MTQYQKKNQIGCVVEVINAAKYDGKEIPDSLNDAVVDYHVTGDGALVVTDLRGTQHIVLEGHWMFEVPPDGLAVLSEKNFLDTYSEVLRG